jgi:hypothetical protein
MRKVTFEWTDDMGITWDVVYPVPDDAPENLTEGEAEDFMLTNFPGAVPDYIRR